MGVSGCGKSTIGSALGVDLNVPFLDGDHYHTPEAVEKMRGGQPLTDDDRWPWFVRLTKEMKLAADQRGKSITACSALKRAYRDYLTEQAGEAIAFIHLSGTKETIAERQADRPGHYMPAGLLDSQFATLEIPDDDENVLSISVDQPVETIVVETLTALRV
ncbi:MAG: gluconokinase [Rhizobiaceae bacterium]|nr:gluconokinase [Rhizobiaceae bacterium]